MKTPRLAALASVAVLAAACGAPRTAPADHVVVITLDTTRADRLTPYGYMGASMPHLERLAREGVVFDRAMSVAPLTLPAHASLFTGLWPTVHGIGDNLSPPLAESQATLAESLAGQGFRTAAFVGSVVLDADRGLGQGFARYGQTGTDAGGGRSLQRPAAAVVDEAIEWLEGEGDTRSFLWVHLYDPHQPYAPPEPFASRQADPYIGELEYTDAEIGRLLAALEARGRLDRSLVIVAGDHGESLGEHGEETHGLSLYESVLRVPLIVRAPGVAPRRVPDLVRLVDVMPTVLDLLGVPAPAMDGVSLAGSMHGVVVDLEGYAESEYPRRFGRSALRALRDARFKLIDAPVPELYDLARDPFEQHNIYGERAAVARAMQRRLAEIGGEWSSRQRDAVEDLPPDVRERLAALGYAGARSRRK